MSNTRETPELPMRRPLERESLYNPAFMALLIAQLVTAYEAKAKRGMPLSLIFLAAPVVLHGPTRDALPSQARHKMASWLEHHPILRAGLAPRARSLAGDVRGGLRRGLRAGTLTLENSALTSSKPKLKGKDIVLSAEVDYILKRAELVGGWFGLSGSPAGIYALWRVRP